MENFGSWLPTWDMDISVQFIISRAWVSEDAASSRIIYFASGTFSAQRLQSYGVHCHWNFLETAV